MHYEFKKFPLKLIISLENVHFYSHAPLMTSLSRFHRVESLINNNDVVKNEMAWNESTLSFEDYGRQNIFKLLARTLEAHT